MKDKAYREILIFVLGTTPQVITETLYALTQECVPPVFPDEIHVITTTTGREKIEDELFQRGRLKAFQEEYGLPAIPLSPESIHVVHSRNGDPLDDIRSSSDNEVVADFIVDFIRERTRDESTRLHCSLAGGRKTMSFYLGSALQLFGRPWDRLYHVLVTPEFESHPDFYYKPKEERFLDVGGSGGMEGKKLNTRDAQILLAELPFIRLRDKIRLGERGFKDLVREGQKEIDTALVQPALRANLIEKTVYIGQTCVDLIPIQMVLYVNFLRRKVEACPFPSRPYCLDCTDCFPYLGDLSKRKALEEMTRDYQKAYGPSSGRVDEFQRHWERKGGIDQDTLRQNISKINRALKEHVEDEALLPYVTITAVGKHGSKRYGVRAEKGKIVIE